MQLTLHVKHGDGFPPPPPPVLATIFTHPNTTPHFDFLLASNYLSEFKTEVDKARVRNNLGIADSYSYHWGNITGNIENQRDLWQKLSAITTKQNELLTNIQALNNSIVDLNGGNNITSLQLAIRTLLETVANHTTNISQNSTAILDIYRNGVGSGGSGEGSLPTYWTDRISANAGSISSLLTNIATINSSLNSLDNRIQSLEEGSGGSEGSIIIQQLQARILALENAIKFNELDSTLRVTGITNNTCTAISGRTPARSVRILASYSGLVQQKDVTEICSCFSQDPTVAYWDDVENKITFGEVGATVLIFSFLTATVSVNITVTASGEASFTLYVGYAPSYANVVGNENCRKNTIAGTYKGTPIALESSGLTGLWVCALIGTEQIKSITEQGYSVSDVISTRTYTTNAGVQYNCYLIATIDFNEINNTEFVITVL